MLTKGYLWWIENKYFFSRLDYGTYCDGKRWIKCQQYHCLWQPETKTKENSEFILCLVTAKRKCHSWRKCSDLADAPDFTTTLPTPPLSTSKKNFKTTTSRRTISSQMFTLYPGHLQVLIISSLDHCVEVFLDRNWKTVGWQGEGQSQDGEESDDQDDQSECGETETAETGGGGVHLRGQCQCCPFVWPTTVHKQWNKDGCMVSIVYNWLLSNKHSSALNASALNVKRTPNGSRVPWSALNCLKEPWKRLKGFCDGMTDWEITLSSY